MKRLFLIRHGDTYATEHRLYYGASDLPVTERGLDELAKYRELYAELIPGPAKFFTTGMVRTEQTLEVLFGHDGIVPEHEVIPNFREINFGIFEMHAYDELKDRPDYQAWISGDYYANVPQDGESFAEMEDRISHEYVKLEHEWLMDKEYDDYVVVCHSGTIFTIMHRLFETDMKNIYEWQPKPGLGYIVKGIENRDFSYKNIG